MLMADKVEPCLSAALALGIASPSGGFCAPYKAHQNSKYALKVLTTQNRKPNQSTQPAPKPSLHLQDCMPKKGLHMQRADRSDLTAPTAPQAPASAEASANKLLFSVAQRAEKAGTGETGIFSRAFNVRGNRDWFLNMTCYHAMQRPGRKKGLGRQTGWNRWGKRRSRGGPLPSRSKQ